MHSRLLTEMDNIGSGIRPRDLLSPGIVAPVANVTNRGRRSMCSTDMTTLRLVL